MGSSCMFTHSQPSKVRTMEQLPWWGFIGRGSRRGQGSLDPCPEGRWVPSSSSSPPAPLLSPHSCWDPYLGWWWLWALSSRLCAVTGCVPLCVCVAVWGWRRQAGEGGGLGSREAGRRIDREEERSEWGHEERGLERNQRGRKLGSDGGAVEGVRGRQEQAA